MSLKNKRPWRKLLKKQQRKCRRQRKAKERDKELEQNEEQKLVDPLYKSWLDNLEKHEEFQRMTEENESKMQNILWLQREEIAQEQFRKDHEKLQAEEAQRQLLEQKQNEEQLARKEAQRKRREEQQRQAKLAMQEFEETIRIMNEYFENKEMKTPTRLQSYVETRPAEKLCELFERTNCCRFTSSCTYNHKRPLLSKIIVLRHFFNHPLLEHRDELEYNECENKLQYTEEDLHETYAEFCTDVWPELEKYGNILNIRTVRNAQDHLRGHVFVEYKEKRSALNAFIHLQNRYYASKRINVEFSNIQHWRTGVCGLFLKRKCPKNALCNFLHLMPNPQNKYNMPMTLPAKNYRYNPQLKVQPLISWNDLNAGGRTQDSVRNWRWSESPELELKSNAVANANVKVTAESKSQSTEDNLRAAEKERSVSKNRENNSDRHRSKNRNDERSRHSNKNEERSTNHHRNRSKHGNDSSSIESIEKHVRAVERQRSKSRNRESSRDGHSYRSKSRKRTRSISWHSDNNAERGTSQHKNKSKSGNKSSRSRSRKRSKRRNAERSRSRQREVKRFYRDHQSQENTKEAVRERSENKNRDRNKSHHTDESKKAKVERSRSRKRKRLVSDHQPQEDITEIVKDISDSKNRERSSSRH